jgi:hypothetical protein
MALERKGKTYICSSKCRDGSEAVRTIHYLARVLGDPHYG